MYRRTCKLPSASPASWPSCPGIANADEAECKTSNRGESSLLKGDVHRDAAIGCPHHGNIGSCIDEYCQVRHEPGFFYWLMSIGTASYSRHAIILGSSQSITLALLSEQLGRETRFSFSPGCSIVLCDGTESLLRGNCESVRRQFSFCRTPFAVQDGRHTKSESMEYDEREY